LLLRGLWEAYQVPAPRLFFFPVLWSRFFQVPFQMDQTDLLFTNPDSLLALSEQAESEWLALMRPMTVLDAKTEANETLEAIWSKSKRGVLFVWLRHFG
jgi:hypothetical protein